MHPADCPQWEYSNHPQKDQELPYQAKQILLDLAQGRLDTLESSVDSRQIHHRLFHKLIPPGYNYYAGHYRGENFRCLHYYSVQIRSDPRVGCPPAQVDAAMRQIRSLLQRGLLALDRARELRNEQLTPDQKVLYVVVFASRVFVSVANC